MGAKFGHRLLCALDSLLTVVAHWLPCLFFQNRESVTDQSGLPTAALGMLRNWKGMRSVITWNCRLHWSFMASTTWSGIRGNSDADNPKVSTSAEAAWILNGSTLSNSTAENPHSICPALSTVTFSPRQEQHPWPTIISTCSRCRPQVRMYPSWPLFRPIGVGALARQVTATVPLKMKCIAACGAATSGRWMCPWRMCSDRCAAVVCSRPPGPCMGATSSLTRRAAASFPCWQNTWPWQKE
mmetsp:Transcript_84137/g.224930  ORF Transcript_84137/g.224930 Transcript_84137/m.224930 type:complete len:241 (-) Transcript_84137:1033-1755(-)